MYLLCENANELSDCVWTGRFCCGGRIYPSNRGSLPLPRLASGGTCAQRPSEHRDEQKLRLTLPLTICTTNPTVDPPL